MGNAHVMGSGGVTNVNGTSGSVIIGGTNLLLDAVAKNPTFYINDVATKKGSVENGVVVAEWGATDATRVTGECTSTKNNKNVVSMSGIRHIQSKEIYTASIFVKNNGGKGIKVKINSGGSIDILPNEAKRLVFTSKPIDYDFPAQIQFAVLDIDDSFDVTYWHPKIEIGNVATEWSPAPEDIFDRMAALEAKIGITYEPPIVEDPEIMVEPVEGPEIDEAVMRT